MNVLVTGAAGYIGSVVCYKLLERGHCVTALDSLVYGERNAIPERAKFYRRDICDPILASSSAFRDIDAVVHLAAESEIPVCQTNPLLAFRVNLGGGINLLKAMQEWEITKLVFSSTSSVYSPRAQVPISEDAPLGPTTPYGASKLAFEQVLPWVNGLRWIAFRYFNACGATEQAWERPYHRSRLTSVALDTASMVRKEPMPLNGTDYDTPDGTCVRDYLHIDDIAEAHVLALENLDTVTGPFNLGIGRGYSNLEVIQTVEKVTGKSVQFTASPRRQGDPPILVSDSTRARNVLGWSPKYTTLEQMLETSWRYEP
jgi:UDP-glucose 4-epimerase